MAHFNTAMDSDAEPGDFDLSLLQPIPNIWTPQDSGDGTMEALFMATTCGVKSVVVGDSAGS